MIESKTTHFRKLRIRSVAVAAVFLFGLVYCGCGLLEPISEDEYFAATHGYTLDELDISRPILVSPDGNATISDTTPFFDWDDIEHARGYHLQCGTDFELNAPLIVDAPDLKTSQYEVSSLLSTDTTYYWKVRAKNVLDMWQNWSEVRAFSETTICNESGLINYSYQPPNPFSTGQTYYWHVRTLNDDGLSGHWSDVRSFTIDPNYGIVARYDLDGDAADSSGNEEDGTLAGVVQTYDRFSNPSSAMSFDGIDDFIQVPHHMDFDFEFGPFTISLWLRTTATTGYGADVRDNPIAKGYFTIDGYGIALRNNRATFFIGHGTELNGTTLINDGEWHHIVGSRDISGKVCLYVDSVLEYTDTNTRNVNTATDLFMGKHGSRADSFFNGMLDDVVIFGRDIDESETLFLFLERFM
jgi:hypothetical protein